MDINFQNKNVLITGGSKGIGKATALAFAEAGADISICARNLDDLNATVDELKQFNHIVTAFQCDIGDPEQARNFVRVTNESLGGIDIVVNNCSAFALKNGGEEWSRNFAVDLMGTVTITEMALELAQVKSIVNVASISAVTANFTHAYGSIKAAVMHYTKSRGRELAEKMIRMNCVVPGAIEFPGGHWEKIKINKPDIYARRIARAPMGRFGTPEEVANLILFLSSDKASYIAGQSFVVDGGQSLI